MPSKTQLCKTLPSHRTAIGSIVIFACALTPLANAGCKGGHAPSRPAPRPYHRPYTPVRAPITHHPYQTAQPYYRPAYQPVPQYAPQPTHTRAALTQLAPVRPKQEVLVQTTVQPEPAPQTATRTELKPAPIPEALANVTNATSNRIRITMPASNRGIAEAATETIETAQAAYRQHNFGTAIRITDQLVEADSMDVEALQLRSLVHMAMGDIENAAIDAYNAVKSARDLWATADLKSLHANMRVLERRIEQLRSVQLGGPAAVSRDFLLAYHDAVAGRYEMSQLSLASVLRSKPDDAVAKAFLTAVEGQLEMTRNISRLAVR